MPLLPQTQQRGAALLITLVMLLIIMLLGMSAARTALMNEKSSRNDRDRQIAFQAADAALHDAELRMVTLSPKLFPEQAGHCHAEFSDLCRAPATGTLAAAQFVAFGRISNRKFPHGAASLARQAPRYLIELFTLGSPGDDNQRYRVTAIGFGARERTQVVLQSIYATSKPAVRLSWREISNYGYVQ